MDLTTLAKCHFVSCYQLRGELSCSWRLFVTYSKHVKWSGVMLGHFSIVRTDWLDQPVHKQCVSVAAELRAVSSQSRLPLEG